MPIVGFMKQDQKQLQVKELVRTGIRYKAAVRPSPAMATTEVSVLDGARGIVGCLGQQDVWG